MMSKHPTLFPEFGSFADNENAFFIAVQTRENGEKEKGMAILCALRQHIVQTGEIRSLQWLLPEIAFIIEHHQDVSAFVYGEA